MSWEPRNKSVSKLEKVKVASTSSIGADVDPKAIDLAMQINERMVLKMKEDKAKNKIEEEENDQWRPNVESTSTQGSSFKSTSCHTRFWRKTECIAYVDQDPFSTHMLTSQV
jgi:hypothetical protein